MEPLFPDGSFVWVFKWAYFLKTPKSGDVVVFSHAGNKYLKRIKYYEAGKYFLAGDNEADSYDSRKFGLLQRKEICGKVIGQ